MFSRQLWASHIKTPVIRDMQHFARELFHVTHLYYVVIEKFLGVARINMHTKYSFYIDLLKIKLNI